jgi:DNA-binding response OmpR family regulator
VDAAAVRLVSKDNSILIAGEKPPRRVRGESSFHLVERGYGRFARAVRASRACDTSKARAVLVDGELRVLPPNGMTLLRALARRPGRVVSRAELLAALPGKGNDEHAVETAVARLRAALGRPKLVQTVVKRGYRLAV